jgi:hypothetical protein
MKAPTGDETTHLHARRAIVEVDRDEISILEHAGHHATEVIPIAVEDHLDLCALVVL